MRRARERLASKTLCSLFSARWGSGNAVRARARPVGEPRLDDAPRNVCGNGCAVRSLRSVHQTTTRFAHGAPRAPVSAHKIIMYARPLPYTGMGYNENECVRVFLPHREAVPHPPYARTCTHTRYATMDSGFEALPRRETGRAAKRRRAGSGTDRGEAEGVHGAVPPTPTSDAAAGGGAAGSASGRCAARGWGMSVTASPQASYEGAKYGVDDCYEYLDHTADVQLHAWGATLEDALARCALAMFGYMTEPDSVEVQPEQSMLVCAEGVL
ncbi:archease [archaeon]|nr:MAG: archease [archaeon]